MTSSLSKIMRYAAALTAIGLATPTTLAEDHEVLCEGVAFIPADITVAPGDTITWVWVDSFHTVTSGTNCVFDNGLFNVTLHAGNPTFVWNVPATPGVLDYFCAPHCPLGMVGTVTIEEETKPCIGDTNDDGDVNVTDLLGLLAQWQMNNPIYDLNDDEIVDIQDLLMLLANWGSCA